MASWGVRRQFFLLSAFFLAVVLVGGLIIFFSKDAPNCFDSQKNQNEIGVDCGGACQAVCQEEISPLVTLWVRPFKVAHGRFGVVALLENSNLFGSGELRYRFKLYDNNNLLVKEREGLAYVNPSERFVVFETNIDTGNREVSRAFVELEPVNSWIRFPREFISPKFSILNKKLILAPTPRVSAVLRNDSSFLVKDIEVVAVIFDVNKNAISGSKTEVEALAPDKTKEVFFTWPENFSASPSFVEIFPRVREEEYLF